MADPIPNPSQTPGPIAPAAQDPSNSSPNAPNVDAIAPTVTPDNIEAPMFAVGDHARHTALGVDRAVFGVRRSPEGEFLLFSAEGQWQSAVGFELVLPQE